MKDDCPLLWINLVSWRGGVRIWQAEDFDVDHAGIPGRLPTVPQDHQRVLNVEAPTCIGQKRTGAMLVELAEERDEMVLSALHRKRKHKHAREAKTRCGVLCLPRM